MRNFPWVSRILKRQAASVILLFLNYKIQKMIVNSRSEPDYEINSSYSEINDSFSFFGPMRMAFFDDGQAIEEKGFVKLILTICLTVIMILSIIGNVCTCAVIARDRTMRTPTNCYLLNLAITDLMIGLFIPIEIYMVWVPDNYPLGEQGCRIHFVLLDCLSNCSILTIVAFTIERYLVVSKPFLRQKLALNRRVFKIVAIIWIIACIFCIPDLFYIDLLARTKYAYCYFYQPDALKTLIIIEILVFFMMPGAVLFIFYVLIALKLKSAQLKLRSSPIDQRQNRDKAVNLLAAVAVSFFFCWTPYCIFRFMMVIPIFEDEDYYYVWRIMNYLSYNGYTSTAVNPILYSLMSQKFRQAFKDFLKGRNSIRSRNRKGSSGITNRSITQYKDSRFN